MEDSEAGLLSAQAAGLRCLLTPSPWDAGLTQLFGQAAAVFDHLGDVKGSADASIAGPLAPEPK